MKLMFITIVLIMLAVTSHCGMRGFRNRGRAGQKIMRMVTGAVAKINAEAK